jgi:hypothetical protein
MGRSGDEVSGSSYALQPKRSVTIVAPKRPDTMGLPPPELVSFIDRQEEYIEQLEKESQYCRVCRFALD